MFEEVSCAICLVCLSSRSSVNPNTNGRSLCPRRVFCGNLVQSADIPAPPTLLHTVRPFDRVVDSVFTPFFTTGVAKPLLNGATVLRATRLRSPWVRLRANRRDAMEVDVKEVADVLELKILDEVVRFRTSLQICRSSFLWPISVDVKKHDLPGKSGRSCRGSTTFTTSFESQIIHTSLHCGQHNASKWLQSCDQQCCRRLVSPRLRSARSQQSYQASPPNRPQSSQERPFGMHLLEMLCQARCE